MTSNVLRASTSSFSLHSKLVYCLSIAKVVALQYNPLVEKEKRLSNLNKMFLEFDATGKRRPADLVTKMGGVFVGTFLDHVTHSTSFPYYADGLRGRWCVRDHITEGNKHTGIF